MGESYYQCADCGKFTLGYTTPTCRCCGGTGMVRFTRPLNPIFQLKKELSEADRAYHNKAVIKAYRLKEK